MEIISWFKKIGVGVVKNGCYHSVLSTLELAVCQGEMNEINWFLVRWYKFWNAKSYFKIVLKNGPDLLGLGILKSVVSQEPNDEMDWFFACWYNLGKLKIF